MSTDCLAHAFVETYYTRLSRSPELLHRFYGADSTLVRSTEGNAARTATATGQSEIRTQLAEQELQGCQVLVRNITAVRTSQNSIVVVVLGERALAGAPPQQFSQTFVLAESEKDTFYILSDVLSVFDPAFDAARPESEPTAETAQPGHTAFKDSDPEPNKPDEQQQDSVPPNSWAAVLAQPAAPPKPAAKPVARSVGTPAAKPAAPATSAIAARKAPSPYSAFLKLSSSTAITKQAAAKALQPWGPISNLYLDLPKRRGYVDFPDQQHLDRALKTARVKLAGGRESIDILRRFSGPPPSSSASSSASARPDSTSSGATSSGATSSGAKKTAVRR